jgi:hypothetical protein
MSPRLTSNFLFLRRV